MTVDLPLPRGVVVGVDSELLPPATVGTADGGTSIDGSDGTVGKPVAVGRPVAVVDVGVATVAAAEEAAKREVALAERNPSDRRRFIMG